MCRKLFFFLAILTFSLAAFSQANTERQKVAVVLSGGGAKGVAHARALKVIEEAGIPVDIVVGTSMGSIVGGLYASGYNAEQLDSIIAVQNWTQILTDGVDRRQKSLVMRQETEKYIVSARFAKSPFEVVQGGILKGNNVAMLMTELTADRQESMNYDDLPIRFACVSTNILKNSEYVMHSGILAESMRSSMAIPGVFAAVRKDSLVLVDGGLTNNFPVDVARRMGADIVIGVDVSDENVKTAADMGTPMAVLMQMVDNACSNKQADNIANTDVYIKVDVKNYTAASFTKTAIDTLLIRGENAARAKWDELVALRPMLGLPPDPQNINRPKKQLNWTGPVVPPSSIYNSAERPSYIGLGARFDSEELASILLGGMYEFNHRNKFRAGLDIRLGKRFYANVRSSVKVWEKWTLGLQYMFKINTFEIDRYDKPYADVKYNEHFTRLGLSRSWKMMKITFGADYSNKNYTKVNTNEADAAVKNLNHENHIAYNVEFAYDNMDDKQYPHKGLSWNARYDYFTDNGGQFNGQMGQHIVSANFKIAIPFSKSTFFVPYIAARFIPSKNTYFSNLNYIGGIDHDGFFVAQQLSFAGINSIQAMDNNLAIAGITLRQRIFTNHYAFCVVNGLTEGSKLNKIFDTQYIGAALGYGYRSPVGPIEANFNWSNITKKLGFYISLGYNF